MTNKTPRKSAQGEPRIKILKLSELKPDDKNANRGTERGLAMLDDSLREDGAGRGILLDKEGRIIGGNKTVERALDDGFDEIIVVETTGKQLVANQRVDVELDSEQGRRMALRDNRISQVDLDFDPDILKELNAEGLDISKLWSEGELTRLFGEGETLTDTNEAWGGMPEFVNEEVRPYKTLLVHFKSQQDVDAFSELVKQNISEGTKFIYYPERPKRDLLALEWKRVKE